MASCPGARLRAQSSAAIVLVSLAAAVLGCDSTANEPRPPAPEPVPPLRSMLTKVERLQADYLFKGRRRHVDARIAFDNLVDPYRDAVTVPARGTRMVAVQLRIVNRGVNPFPLEWARLRGYDERGRAMPAGSSQTPVRKTLPERPFQGQLLASTVAFQVPRGRRLAAIRMRSIVDLWRFRADWTLAP